MALFLSGVAAGAALAAFSVYKVAVWTLLPCENTLDGVPTVFADETDEDYLPDSAPVFGRDRNADYNLDDARDGNEEIYA
jgi:hypothetical protein